MSNQPIHVLDYGDSGGGKSTFARTFPKPLIVFMFDPVDKSMPYRKGCTLVGQGHDQHGTPFGVYTDKRGEEIRVEYYIDANYQQPDAWSRFLKRMTTFHGEYSKWASAVLDSVTFAELAARKMSQYVVNRTVKDGRQHFGFSTDAIEEMLLSRWANLPLNVVVLAHVDEDKDEVHGTFVRSPKMPGQRLRKGAMAGFGETYRSYVARNADGKSEYMLQTQADAMWNAASQIGAPNPCPPHYLALWAGDEEEAA